MQFGYQFMQSRVARPLFSFCVGLGKKEIGVLGLILKLALCINYSLTWRDCFFPFSPDPTQKEKPVWPQFMHNVVIVIICFMVTYNTYSHNINVNMVFNQQLDNFQVSNRCGKVQRSSTCIQKGIFMFEKVFIVTKQYELQQSLSQYNHNSPQLSSQMYLQN